MSNLLRIIAAAISAPPRTRKMPRRVGVDLEVLGERTLLSVSPIHAVAVHTPIAHLHLIPLPHVVRVPDLRGYTFYLNSTNGKPAHTLVIKTETYNRFGSASFTGTWQETAPTARPWAGRWHSRRTATPLSASTLAGRMATAVRTASLVALLPSTTG